MIMTIGDCLGTKVRQMDCLVCDKLVTTQWLLVEHTSALWTTDGLFFLQTLRLSQFNSLFNLDISPGKGRQGNVEDQNLQVAWALLYHFL